MAVSSVWIEEGCTMCGLCTGECPDVFDMGDESAIVKEGADLSANEECVKSSAEACPVDVIKYEES